MYLNTPVVYSASKPNVDRNKGIISNVTIAQTGIAKGHNISLDDDFINDVVSKGNSHGPGLKARFGHPNICATALGTYLGRFKNFRKSDGSAIADMHLDKTAIKSPNGDLYNYVLDMADNNPDMFGASIAFKKGKSKEKPDPAKPGSVMEFATIDTLYAADFVDSPAATDGLFELFHEDDLASQMTIFLDEHPDIFQLVEKKPDILIEFMNKYKIYKDNKMMSFADSFSKVTTWASDQLSSFFSDNSPDTPEDVINALKSDFASQLDVLNKSFTSEMSVLSDDNTRLSSELADVTSQFNQLKATKSDPKGGDPALKLQREKKQTFSLLADAPKEVARRLKTQLKN